jgi:hypothetical protein
MDVVGAVTAGAAGLAAVFGGLNLYVSGQRELNKWTRETLVETFVTFLDASFKNGSACGFLLRKSPPEPERHRLRAAAVAAHDLEAETLTRLRLLAPSRVVRSAEALLDAEHRVATACFSDSLPPVEDLHSLFEPVRQARAQLLESARSTMRLPEAAGTAPFPRNNSWREFRTIVHETAEQDGAAAHDEI